jgi:hypothetical protein
MNINKGFLMFLICSFISACDPASAPWLAGVPVRVDINSNVPSIISRTTLENSITDRLAQFGMQVKPTAQTAITINYDKDCKCPACNLPSGVSKDQITAYVNKYDFKNIYICPGFLSALTVEDPNRFTLITIGHEVCHVLGLDGHTGTGQGNLCSPGFQDHKNINPIQFSKTDIKAICDSGGIKSNVCY